MFYFRILYVIMVQMMSSFFHKLLKLIMEDISKCLLNTMVNKLWGEPMCECEMMYLVYLCYKVSKLHICGQRVIHRGVLSL